MAGPVTVLPLAKSLPVPYTRPLSLTDMLSDNNKAAGPMASRRSQDCAMRQITKPLAIAALMASAQFAHAGPGPDDVYVGVGFFNDLLNVNVEYVSEDLGNFVVRVGQFQDINHGVSGNVSWRKPITSDNPKEDGYFVGVFAGHVVGDTLDGEYEYRLGGGGELGYHWVSDHTRKVFSVGIGAAEAMTGAYQTLEAEPTIFFELSIGLGY